MRSLLTSYASLPSWAKALYVLAIVLFIASSFAILAALNSRFLIEVPRTGGVLVEGIIGRPRFINPVIARSDADRDMTELIYSGLLKATPDGDLVPDLALSYTLSPDGLTYTFLLKEKLFWHDGVALTSEDIAFTIEKVRDPSLAIKSPRRASWEGVDVETPDPKTVIFRLKQPYAPFLESATMGIIPKHIWKDIPNEEFDVTYYNIEPIGSGPYRVANIVRDNDKGLPRNYDLVAYKRYVFGEPYITSLQIVFFGNDQELLQAYRDRTIDQIHTIGPVEARAFESQGIHVNNVPLPRVFAAFFNQNQQPIFAEKSVRKALDRAINKDALVKEVLDGFGKAANGPLLSVRGTNSILESVGTSTPTTKNSSSTDVGGESGGADHIQEARAMLEETGWQRNAANIYEKTDTKKKTVTLLKFSMSLPDVPELRAAAEIMKRDWETLGASVTIKIFDSSTFAADVFAPRKYDVLFYGQIIGRLPDPYAYWHSSQRNSPGLNVALYTNKTADKLLEDIRKESDPSARDGLLSTLSKTITDDTPAIFVYTPDFLYVTAQKVRGIHLGLMTTESERFLGIEHWYIDSERVWKWFADRSIR